MLEKILARQQRAAAHRLLMKHQQRRKQQNQNQYEVRRDPAAQRHLHRNTPVLAMEQRHSPRSYFCYTQTGVFCLVESTSLRYPKSQRSYPKISAIYPLRVRRIGLEL